MNIYIKLTEQFNYEKKRAILSSGQAVVLHRITMMSKDGDWIIKDDQESLDYILGVLSNYQAVYRFGAPLDLRWLRGGWSSHFEFSFEGLRIRTDFVTHPPRINQEELKQLWKEDTNPEKESIESDIPFVDSCTLIKLKQTMREKDYPIIGELARITPDLENKILYSRSANDLKRYFNAYPNIFEKLTSQRPLLNLASQEIEELESALDKERRDLMKKDQMRLKAYDHAKQNWQKKWPTIQDKIQDLDLISAHKILVKEAEGVIPFSV